MGNLKRNILISAILGLAVFLALAVWADAPGVIGAFRGFQWQWVPGILFLTSLNYGFRFWKWDYYLARLNIAVTKKDSASVFFSGLALSVTPYKAGEVVKSYFLRQLNGASIMRTAPIVFAERLTDLTGLIVLASFGALSYSFGMVVIAATLGTIIAIVLVVQSKRITRQLISFSCRLPVVRRFGESLTALFESAGDLLAIRPMLGANLLSVVSWFFECLATYYVVRAFGVDISLVQATFVFAFSSIAGSIVMLPGGLGVAEASMAGLLLLFEVPREVAVSSTLIIRACTLWFGVILGAITMSSLVRRLAAQGAQTDNATIPWRNDSCP